MSLRAENKLVIGLTGNMASGKSTALAFFAGNGAETLSADALVKELYTRAEVRKKLTDWFGSCEPAAVAERVFARADERKKLERFLHPLVLREAALRIQASPRGLAVFEVPLLFEAGWNRLTDLNVVVLGAPATLAARLKARGIAPAEYKRRLKTQMPAAQKASLADVVLFNGAGKKELGEKVKRLCQAFKYIYGLK